eukprot:GGOE01008898.1.p1 GENE.GGOE01008898.1~~GGOE01008898.1.p1  ORF type:complete len:103 (-),score=1.18 GGOE01008898.1:108-416(-)
MFESMAAWHLSSCPPPTCRMRYLFFPWCGAAISHAGPAWVIQWLSMLTCLPGASARFFLGDSGSRGAAVLLLRASRMHSAPTPSPLISAKLPDQRDPTCFVR